LYEWCSLPLASSVTISGSITLNLWAGEEATSANAAVNAIIERLDSQGAIVSTIVKTARTTEVAEVGINGWASCTVNNFTASPTSTTLSKGDRIRVRVFFDDVGTMGSTVNLFFCFNIATPSNLGDSYVTFTEDITFTALDSATGSTLYLTDTAGPVVGAATEREMWRSRGAGVQTDVVNTASGFMSPIQWTDTAGGAVVEWYSKPLAAFTLAGLVYVNLRVVESDLAANVGIRGELAVCDGDGVNAVIWAAGNFYQHASPGASELAQAEGNHYFELAGVDTAVTQGQRLRLRVYLDDTSVPAVTGYTATLYYAGTSSGASGDSYLTLPVMVVESGQQGIYPDADTATTGWSSTPLWSKVDEASPDGTVISATASQ